MNLKYIPFLLLTLLSRSICLGQVETFFVNPIQIDANYGSEEDSMAISINYDIQQDRIFLFIGGTKSSSSRAYNALRRHSAELGINFINLSYPNSIAAASLSNDSDDLVFDKYRQELCFGTPLSNAVDVDSFNSIYTRTLKLLQYLNIEYPSDNWGQYLLTANTINWSKIIIGGHSQGAGHACYIAKKFEVDRVCMFSGPNDYSAHFENAANWLSEPGITSIDRHFAYLSLNDEVVDFNKQYINLTALGMRTNDDSTYVDNLSQPYMNSHILYTTQSPGLLALINHSVPVKFSDINDEVWFYMLNSSIISDANDLQRDYKISISPNPAKDQLLIISDKDFINESYLLYNMAGQVVLSGSLSAIEHSIDLSRLINGLYLLSIDDHVVKVLKQ